MQTQGSYFMSFMSQCVAMLILLASEYAASQQDVTVSDIGDQS